MVKWLLIVLAAIVIIYVVYRYHKYGTLFTPNQAILEQSLTVH